MNSLIFIHGYESSGESTKAKLISKIFPDLSHPTFTGELDERMSQLNEFLSSYDQFVLIGSSFGGLMASLYAKDHPKKIERLILLAPALTDRYMPKDLDIGRITIPTLLIHGQNDEEIPLNIVLPKAQEIFAKLEFRLVDDDHRLHNTTEALDWEKIIQPKGEN